MTTNFALSTLTLLSNGKWVQKFSIFEKKLKSHEVICIHKDENIITRQIIDEFIFFYPKMEFLLTEIKTSLSIDRQKFLETNEPVLRVVKLGVTLEFFRKHLSCWENHDAEIGPVTRSYAKKNGIESSCVKRTLKNLKANSPAMNFFTQNSCPVCLANYKEVIEEDHHIVIPACGHPICCKCCDELLRNDGRCSICRDDYNIDEFDIMIFDINLQPIPHKRKVFY